MASPYIFGNKPSGVTTHASAPHLPGYQDWLAQSIGLPLFTCHRLDKETTGALLFATTSESASELSELFAHQAIHKKYLFITDRPITQKNWTCTEPLSTQKSSQKVPATTTFEVIKTQGRYSLIKAEPQTGRTHQVRIHAQHSHIPLLGDTRYGGTSFPQFYLHCQELSVPQLNIQHVVAPPLIMNHLEALEHPLLCQWLTSIDTRQRLYGEFGQHCYRLIHDEGTPLRLDLVGHVGCAGWWDAIPPSHNELELLKRLFDILSITEWRLMHYSGQRQKDICIVDHISREEWVGQENAFSFTFKKETGLSCGLFLDQRENRQWISTQSSGKSLLNLFAYTGGFSVAGALGGATKTTTVDLSKKYIEWTKSNFKLNQISVENHDFYALDSLEYLKFAAKKGIQFDIIVCDPPSFSRDKKGHVFQIEKHFVKLLEATLNVLSPKGFILFSTNYEKWSLERWFTEMSKNLSTENIEITKKLSFQWDFEKNHERHMKAFLITKK